MRAEADLGQRRRDLIGYRLMRAWAISFQNTAPACVSRARSAIIVAARPLRSSSDEPLDLVGSVCGHHARIVRWRRRSGVEASSVIASLRSQ